MSQSDNCIFCRILSGLMPGRRVYEDNLMAGVLDINPCTKGHMLLMPMEHYPIIQLLPSEIFNHMFGLLPRIIRALKDAMLVTGVNVFIANGAVAGQQSPHFLVHLIPREDGDSLDNYSFVRGEEISEDGDMLSINLKAMMKSHFAANPADWHNGSAQVPGYLEEIEGSIAYSDEKALVVMPKIKQCRGHMVVYSTEEEKFIENLSGESSAHLFQTASNAATTVFETLGAQGSNIILKSGKSLDNENAMLCIHILPRYQDDGINVLWKPMARKPKLDEIEARIKDQTFSIPSSGSSSGNDEPGNCNDEIMQAIDILRNS